MRVRWRGITLYYTGHPHLNVCHNELYVIIRVRRRGITLYYTGPPGLNVSQWIVCDHKGEKERYYTVLYRAPWFKCLTINCMWSKVNLHPKQYSFKHETFLQLFFYKQDCFLCSFISANKLFLKVYTVNCISTLNGTVEVKAWSESFQIDLVKNDQKNTHITIAAKKSNKHRSGSQDNNTMYFKQQRSTWQSCQKERPQHKIKRLKSFGTVLWTEENNQKRSPPKKGMFGE